MCPTNCLKLPKTRGRCFFLQSHRLMLPIGSHDCWQSFKLPASFVHPRVSFAWLHTGDQRWILPRCLGLVQKTSQDSGPINLWWLAEPSVLPSLQNHTLPGWSTSGHIFLSIKGFLGWKAFHKKNMISTTPKITRKSVCQWLSVISGSLLKFSFFGSKKPEGTSICSPFVNRCFFWLRSRNLTYSIIACFHSHLIHLLFDQSIVILTKNLKIVFFFLSSWCNPSYKYLTSLLFVEGNKTSKIMLDCWTSS